MDLLPRFCVIQRFVAFNAVQAKERSYRNQHPTEQFLLLTIYIYMVAYTNMSMCFYTIVPMPFKACKDQKAIIFLPWSFSLSKSFNHITKDTSIFHLKLGGSCRFSYFSTSTPLGHTSHHHKQSIVGCQFLT